MLTVEHVSKRYGKFKANDDVSIEVPGGKIAVLLGPNGAGKSTLIKSIAGLLRFDGSISIDGYGNKTLEAKRALGYVPEIPAVYELLTVREHMEFISKAYKQDLDEEYLDSLLKRFELDDKQDKLGKELSKGMQQKVSILCALISKPSMLILDEPLVGLDPHAIKELKLMLQELRDKGVAILISTHMLDSVEDFWDEAHIMMKGKIVAEKFNGEESDDEKTLEQLFFEITEGKGAAEK